MFAFQSYFSQEYHLQDQMIGFLPIPSAGMTKKEGERHNFLSLSHSVLHPFLFFPSSHFIPLPTSFSRISRTTSGSITLHSHAWILFLFLFLATLSWLKILKQEDEEWKWFNSCERQAFKQNNKKITKKGLRDKIREINVTETKTCRKWLGFYCCKKRMTWYTCYMMMMLLWVKCIFLTIIISIK